jgi:hypothetical protein
VIIDMEQMRFGDIIVDVEQRNIKNIYLRVYPPAGKVRIAAPLKMDLDSIRAYTVANLNWIKKQQDKLKAQDREVPKIFMNGETHYYNGKRYLLKVVEVEIAPKIELENSTLILYVRPHTSTENRQRIINKWYRDQLKLVLPELIEKWERKMNVKVHEFRIKKMKTKWGSCNCKVKRIWLNLELAIKPPECVEYVVVHEMVHLLERKHTDRFTAYMNKYLPKWRLYKDELNGLSVKHEKWNY